MKRYVKVSFLTLLSVIFILSGCGWFSAQKGNTDVDACVYYIEENGTVLVETNVSLPSLTKEEKAEYLIDMLINAPDGKISPICDGTKLKSVTIKDEIATVDFSKEFSNYDDLKNILAPTAVAKTLCSLDFISGTSSGSIIATLYAIGYNYEEIYERFIQSIRYLFTINYY